LIRGIRQSLLQEQFSGLRNNFMKEHGEDLIDETPTIPIYLKATLIISSTIIMALRIIQDSNHTPKEVPENTCSTYKNSSQDHGEMRK
jgi:hypothetical protein